MYIHMKDKLIRLFRLFQTLIFYDDGKNSFSTPTFRGNISRREAKYQFRLSSEREMFHYQSRVKIITGART